jgi:hypothetical protein
MRLGGDAREIATGDLRIAEKNSKFVQIWSTFNLQKPVGLPAGNKNKNLEKQPNRLI